MNTASTPEATPARARGSMYSDCPPVAWPSPPGNCNECVTSKTTGTPNYALSRTTACPRPGCYSQNSLHAQSTTVFHSRLPSLIDNVLRIVGGENCPFFTFTARPDAPQPESNQSDAKETRVSGGRRRLRQRWRTCETSCTSVNIGTRNSSLHVLQCFEASSMPRPRKLLIDDRLALSKDALKTKSRPASFGHA